MTDSNQPLSASDWKALLDECEQSNESQAKFCKRKGLRYTSFCYWRSQLKLKKPKSKAKHSFKKAAILPISNETQTVPNSKDIRIHVGNKLRLVCDISLLPEMLRLLKPLLENADVSI